MCTHLPLGIHMLLLICMQKIHWAFLFVNRKCLDLHPDKGSYYKHNMKLRLYLMFILEAYQFSLAHLQPRFKMLKMKKCQKTK